MDPGPHVLTVRRIAPRSTVPVLISGKQVLHGSSEILDYAAESLGVDWLRFPPADAERLRELENVANRDFGRGVQTIAYDVLLSEPATLVELWYLYSTFRQNPSPTERVELGTQREITP